jgi:hypothetical protein
VSERTNRRALLSRLGLAAGAAGAVSVLGANGASLGRATGTRATARPTVIHGADWRVTWPGVPNTMRPPNGSPRLPHGRLVDDAGMTIGTFEASVMPAGGLGTHMHRLELDGGTLTAVGPATFDDATFAVIGGTGVYHGAAGSYHLTQRPAPSGGTATFTIDITTPEA